MSFCIFNSDVLLCNNDRVVIYNVEDDVENVLHLPELNLEKKTDVHNNVDIDTFHTITSIMFSNDGEYFLVCTNRKQLCLYERKTRKLLSNRTLARAASRVRFSPNNDIVIADKTGDAYVYSSKIPTQSGVLILGHLSMLLDILITNDEKHVITTDRDEKIRVSMYPNCYNIMSYCLGHTKFVTNISELPHQKNVLVSVGGDGVYILWDFKLGKELLSINFYDKIPKCDIEKFNQNLQEYHLDELVDILPVKHMRLSKLSAATSLLLLSFYSSGQLLVYTIDGTIRTGLKVTYIDSLYVENEPVECILHKRNLWILNESGLKVYEFKDDRFVLSEVLNAKLKRLNTSWERLKKSMTQQNLFPILYKRKYDNVQEYLERKKTRFGNVTE